MRGYVQDFSDFINEELNYRNLSETECVLTRPWYYYDSEDDILYGSDVRPETSGFVFENSDGNGMRLFILDTDRNSAVIVTGEEQVMERLVSDGYRGDIGDIAALREFFDGTGGDERMLLTNGSSLLASSVDIIEEN